MYLFIPSCSDVLMSALHRYLQFIGSGSYVCRLINFKDRDFFFFFLETYLALREVSFSLIFINRRMCVVEVRCVTCKVRDEF